MNPKNKLNKIFKNRFFLQTIALLILFLSITTFISPSLFVHPNSTAPKTVPVSHQFKGEHFYIIAGPGGQLDFNGTVPGPSITVSNNTEVWITFTVSPEAGITHSWSVVPANATGQDPNYRPVFKNASTPDPTIGQPIGSVTQIYFNVTKVGSFKYICEVPEHFESGMWGWFNVTAGNNSSVSANSFHIMSNFNTFNGNHVKSQIFFGVGKIEG